MSGETQLERLAAQLAPALLNYFIRRTEPPADAADLLSETLLVMTRRCADLPADDEQARMWAFGVARRVLSTHRRGRKRHAAMLDRLREHLWVQQGQPHVDYQPDLVLSAMSTLRPLDQEIIRLIHWDGFSQVEAAKILSRPPGTIRSRYARARTALKAEMHASMQHQHDHETVVANSADPSSSTRPASK